MPSPYCAAVLVGQPYQRLEGGEGIVEFWFAQRKWRLISLA